MTTATASYLRLLTMAVSVAVLLTATIVPSASAFSPTAQPAFAITTKPSTRLNAWSLPVTNKFGTFSTTWFDVKDPTGRKIVYNDADHADSFSFLTSLGDDWPSMDEDVLDEQVEHEQSRRRRRQPLKRVAAWLRGGHPQ